MSDFSQELSTVNDAQAREVGLPSPSAIQYMMSVANMLITSNLLGPDLEPSKETIQALIAAKWEQSAIDEYRDKVVRSNALAKMLIGREMNMGAMESLQDISIVKAKMFVHYSQLIGQIERKGYTCKWEERSNERAALLVSRNGDETRYEFTIEDAKRAGLLESAPGKEKYNQYIIRPRVMLTARVASEAYRTTGGRANVYTPEEKSEVLDHDSTTGEPTAADAERAAQLQQRYHVAPKAGTVEATATEAPAAPAASSEPAASTTAAPPPTATTTAKPQARKKDKPENAANVVEMPQQTQQAQTQQRVAYLIYATPIGSSNPVQLDTEAPQPKLDVASLRAQSLANQFGVAHFVYPEIDGKVVPNPVFTATVPTKGTTPAPAPPAPPPATAPPIAPTSPAAPQSSPQASPQTTAPAGDGKTSALRERFKLNSKKVAAIVNNGLAPDKLYPEKTVAGRVSTFFMGYFQVPTLKELPPVDGNEAAYDQAFLDLESVAATDANSLMSAPEDTGKRKSANTLRMGGFLRHELKWWPENIGLGFALMRKWNLEFQEMQTFFENAKLVRNNGDGMQSAAQEDIQAALQLCLATRAGGRFIRECNTHNVSIAATLHWMEERRFLGKKLAEVAEVDVEKAIEWASTAIKERAEAEAAKSRPPAPRKRDPEPQASAPAAEADDDEGGLFSDLP